MRLVAARVEGNDRSDAVLVSSRIARLRPPRFTHLHQCPLSQLGTKNKNVDPWSAVKEPPMKVKIAELSTDLRVRLGYSWNRRSMDYWSPPMSASSRAWTASCCQARDQRLRMSDGRHGHPKHPSALSAGHSVICSPLIHLVIPSRLITTAGVVAPIVAYLIVKLPFIL